MRASLEALAQRFDRRYVETDPVSFVLRYRQAGASEADLEVLAFYAAALAYGGVAVIRKNLEALCTILGPQPYRFVLDLTPTQALDAFRGFTHRFHKGPDLALFSWLLRQALQRHGRLETLFSLGDDVRQPDIGPGLVRLTEALLAGDVRPFHPDGVLPRDAPVRHFLPSPASGSACKRLCLFLRWMVRREVPDLGLWRSIDPARLIVPLDTHVARLGRYLGLTQRNAGDWRAAQEVSAGLRQIDPVDPIRFDFPLAHLGIHHCLHRFQADSCGVCPLRTDCALVPWSALERPAQ